MSGDPVFLNYSRSELDREYDNRAKVPQFPDYIDRYTRQSAAARRRYRGRLGLRYGDSAAETLDFFPADAGGGAAPPVNVFIHGGYWKSLSKEEFSFVADAMVPAGVSCAVIDYALIPTVTMDELVRQCRAAVIWVWRNAARLGVDPERLYVSGHSAGGHLTAMTLATDWPAFADGLPVAPLRGGCGISGLYDLEPIRRCFLNDDLQLDAATVARNSPAALPPATLNAADGLLLPVGELEGAEYRRQSCTLAEAWGESVSVKIISGDDHFSIVQQLHRPDSRLSRLLHAQMGVAFC